MWPHLMHLKLKETKILLACTAFYFIICFAVCLISGRAKKMTCVSIFLVCVFLIIVSPVAVQFKNKLKISGRKNKQRFAIIFIVPETSAFFFHSQPACKTEPACMEHFQDAGFSMKFHGIRPCSARKFLKKSIPHAIHTG